MRRTLSRLVLVALSLGGLFGAHQLAFMFAAPHVHDRSELLAATGHGTWLPIVVAAVTSVLLAFLRGSGHGWSQLALLQIAGFVVLEGVERIGAHEGLIALAREPVFWIGLVLQLVVSLLAILLVRVAREVARLFRRVSDAARARVAVFPLVSFLLPVIGVRANAWNLRGPPVPLAV